MSVQTEKDRDDIWAPKTRNTALYSFTTRIVLLLNLSMNATDVSSQSPAVFLEITATFSTYITA